MLPQLVLWLAALPPPAALGPAVHLDDLDRFPPAEVVQANVELSRRHVDFLVARQRHWPHTDRTWLEEARRARNVWQCLGAAQSDHEHERFWHLEDLRDYLGPENYFRGLMPPPVPLHRYRHLDRLPAGLPTCLFPT